MTDIIEALENGEWHDSQFQFELNGKEIIIVQDSTEPPWEWGDNWDCIIKYRRGPVDDCTKLVDKLIEAGKSKLAELSYPKAKELLLKIYNATWGAWLLPGEAEKKARAKQEYIRELALQRREYETFADLAQDELYELIQTNDLEVIELITAELGFCTERIDTQYATALIVAKEKATTEAAKKAIKLWLDGNVWCIIGPKNSIGGVFADDWTEPSFIEAIEEVVGEGK